MRPLDHWPRPLGFVGCRRLETTSGGTEQTLYLATTQIRDDAQRQEINEATRDPLATSFPKTANINTGASSHTPSVSDNHAVNRSRGGLVTFAQQLKPRDCGYRQRYRIELVLQAKLKETAVLQIGMRAKRGNWIIGPDHLDLWGAVAWRLYPAA